MGVLANQPRGERRRHRRRGWFENGQRRFYVMAGLLIAGVTFLLVPAITHLIESMAGYQDPLYNPRDFVRTRWINLRGATDLRSEEHMSELQSHSFISYAVF